MLGTLVVASHRSAHCQWRLAAVDDGSDQPQALGQTVFILGLEEYIAEVDQRCTDVLATQWDVLLICRREKRNNMNQEKKNGLESRPANLFSGIVTGWTGAPLVSSVW